MRDALRWIGAALLLLHAGTAAADGFVTGIDDLPLMSGLEELAGRGMVFDKPEGRIVEAFASGRVSADAIGSFYGATLPQLGWRETAPQEWAREGERLRLSFEAAGDNVTVHFSLTPR